MTDLLTQCLALPLEERKKIVARLSDSIVDTMAQRTPDSAARLFAIYQDLTGRRINLKSHDHNDVWGKVMIAYRMLQEGFSGGAIGRQLNKDHSTIIHYRRKMEFVFEMPKMYSDVIKIWEMFNDKVENYDIHRRTTDNPLSMGGQFPDCGQRTMGEESGDIRTPGHL